MHYGEERTPNGLRSILSTYCYALIGLTLFGWCIPLCEGFFLHRSFPYNWPLFTPLVRFSDLTLYQEKISHLSRGGVAALASGEPMFVYPAPALGLYAFFIKGFSKPLFAYLVVSAVLWLIAFLGVVLYLRFLGKLSSTVVLTLSLTAFCSYPFLFTVDRANLEIVIFGVVLFGVVLFLRSNYLLASTFLSLAACIKPFPLVLFFLFLPRRQYKAVFLGAAIFVSTNLIALWWVGGSSVITAYFTLQAGAANFYAFYLRGLDPFVTPFDHSLFSCMKQLIHLGLGSRYRPLTSIYNAAYLVYVPLIALAMLACGFYFWRKPVLNQLFAVIILILIAPPVSFDYTLLYVYILWGALLIHLLQNGQVKQPLLLLIPLACLMAPQSFLRIGSTGVGGQFKTVVLLFLLYRVTKFDMPSNLFGDRNLPTVDSI